MKTKILIRSLLVASLAVLSACGGDDENNNARCIDGNCDTYEVNPGNNYSSGDYMLQQAIPMLQQQYGSITVPYSIPMMDGLTIKPGTYSWSQMYKTYILGSVSRSGCRTNTNSGGATSPWGTLNYGCFQAKLGNYQGAWTNAYIQFANSRYQYYSFFEVFNWFLSTGSSYAQNTYYPNDGGGGYNGGGGGYNGGGYYGYDPYWGMGQSWGNWCGYGYGQYQPTYYQDSGRFYINVGFSGSL